MYVCVCNAVTDREIQSAVALGAHSLADLKSTLGVATCCGRCEQLATALVGKACRELVPTSPGDD